MKKILFITASCMALYSSYAFAMEDPDKQFLIHSSHRSPATLPELREYIHQVLKKEGMEKTISVFDDFVKGLQNITFSKRKQKLSKRNKFKTKLLAN